MKKSLISKFLLGVMSLSMAFSVVGNNTAKAGGFQLMDDAMCTKSEKLLARPDLSSEEAEGFILGTISSLGILDKDVAAKIFQSFFVRFPHLINIGTEEYGPFLNALYWYVKHDDVAMVKWLIEHGAVWIVKDASGEYVEDASDMFRFAVQRANMTGNNAIVNCLLAHGYDMRSVSMPLDLAKINPPKTGLKARIGKFFGCFGSR